MARPFRQQIDEGIVDRAAALFARRGFAKTSVQEIADAVGLSKAGLLHHFPSKDALWEAVVPGLVALLLAPLTVGDPGAPELEVAGAAALAAFDVDPTAPVSERTVRVTGALTALAVLTLAAHAAQQTTAWRRHILATCFDALGHARPVAALPASDQVEA